MTKILKLFEERRKLYKQSTERIVEALQPVIDGLHTFADLSAEESEVDKVLLVEAEGGDVIIIAVKLPIKEEDLPDNISLEDAKKVGLMNLVSVGVPANLVDGATAEDVKVGPSNVERRLPSCALR